jgi:hypothetical protein
MAHSAIPIYVPTLFPFTYYNLRYGIEMIPAVSIFPSFTLSWRLTRHSRTALLGVFICVVLLQGIDMVSSGINNLAVVQEGVQNNPCRSKKVQALTTYFRNYYDGRTILVASGKWPCFMPALGIPFANTLSEPDTKTWNQLHQAIPKEVQWIIRGDDDSVDQLMRAFPRIFGNFDLVEQYRFEGEGSVYIYRLRTR